MATVLVRRASIDDCERIAAIHVASWRETYRGMIPDAVLDRLSIPVRAQRWREIMSSNPTQPSFVAEIAGEPVGFSSGGARRGQALTQDAEIYALYVARRAQRNGVGSLLMSALVQGFRQRGWESRCLWVARENEPARRFYERLGGEIAAEKVENRPGYDLAEVAYVWSRLDGILTPPRASP